MEPLVIGLVGCGLWGQNILKELIHLGAETLVVDPDADSRLWAKGYGAKETFVSLESLPPVDGFILSTPATMHRQHIETLLGFGQPVFTEKPFVLSLEDALALEELAEDRLFVMHVWRYHPAVQQLKKLISEDQIGKLEQIRTRRCNWTSPRKDVDPIWTLIPHDISILAELTGMVPKAEFAVAEYCNNKPVGMLAHLQATCACVAEVSSRYPEKIREIRVQGTKGTAILRDDGNVVQFYQGDETTDQPCLNNIHVEPQPALRLEIQAFLEYLRGGPPPKTRLNEAIEITRCLTQLRTMAGLTNG